MAHDHRNATTLSLSHRAAEVLRLARLDEDGCVTQQPWDPRPFFSEPVVDPGPVGRGGDKRPLPEAVGRSADDAKSCPWDSLAYDRECFDEQVKALSRDKTADRDDH